MALVVLTIEIDGLSLIDAPPDRRPDVDAAPDGDIAVGGADQSTSDASHAADCEPRSIDVMLFSVVRSSIEVPPSLRGLLPAPPPDAPPFRIALGALLDPFGPADSVLLLEDLVEPVRITGVPVESGRVLLC